MNERLAKLTPVPGRSFLLVQLGQPAKYYYNDEELVFVDRQIFHESDMRFRFKDIHGIWISPSRHFILTTMFLLALLLPVCLIAFLLADTYFDYGIYFGLGGLTFVFTLLGLHYALGPSCNVTLQTRAHRVKLRSIHRRRHAQRFVKTLLPGIERAQAPRTAPPTNDPTES